MNLITRLFIGVPYLLLLCAILPSCTRRNSVLVKKLALPYTARNTLSTVIDISLNSPPAITVWVHGTRFIRHRTNSTLKLINPKKAFYRMATALYETAPDTFPLCSFYSFVWSGGITNQQRANAAQSLYNELQKVVTDYKKIWNVYPVIRIMSHSHGGNVALNMVNCQKQFLSHEPLIIDSLIMFACPVQNNTMYLTQHNMFRSIYSLYSSLDLVQVIAPQKFYGISPFSYRIFPTHNTIVQAKIRINGHAIFHTEFTTHRFFKIFPHIFTTLQELNTSLQQEQKTHILLRINTKV